MTADLEREGFSAFQAAILLAHERDPDGAAFHSAMPLRFRGPLDSRALRRAFAALHERHASLRTTYRQRGTRSVQLVCGRFEPLFEEFEARGLSDIELLRAAESEYRRPFDLGRGAVRAALFRRAPDDHLFLVTLSHVCHDLTSADIFLHELLELYRGAPLPPPPPASYLDFVDWQERFLASPEAEAMAAQAEQALAGVTSSIALPFDRQRPALRRGATGASHTFCLQPELAAALHAVHPNLFRTLLSAYFAFLYRLSGQEDLLCAIPASARAEPRFDVVVGNFVNVLPIRVQVERGLGFRELMERVGTAVRAGGARRDYPYLSLLSRLRRGGDPSRTPLCETSFGMLQMARCPELVAHAIRGAPWRSQRGGLEIRDFPLAQAEGQYDLNAWFCESGGHIWGEFKYARELFDAETVAELSDCFIELLRGVARDPTAQVGKLPLVPEVLQRSRAAADRGPDWPVPTVCVHQLFEDQVDRTPDAVAVSAQGRSLTYAELEVRANRLAHRLIALGIGPGARVAICLERTPELLAALLGVHKAGAGYLPLDPSYPMERMAAMIADGDPSAIVVHSSLLPQLPGAAVEQLLVDDGLLDEGVSTRPLARSGPEDLAYLIYTSGSTGVPKGVEILHRSVVSFLRSMRDRPGIAEGDALLAVTTLSFDIAALELLLPLTVGARILLASREVASDGARLAAFLGQSGASVLQATPATWRSLLEAGWAGDERLKALSGGEALTRELADALLARTGELWNLYGPTETTIWSLCTRVLPGDQPITLGTPIANTSVHVVDAGLQPVPAGVAGELLIGGAGLARGYRARPALNEERFVRASLLAGDERLYRTGDLVRRRRDGALVYVGRADHQVKVRGYRIELGEIEAALRRHPHVQDALAVARDHGAGDKRLCAYIVPNTGAQVAPVELRAMMRRTLPDFMLPSHFVSLEAFPLTPNGKVDRAALPAPADEASAPAVHMPPRNATQAIIAALFAEILGLARPVGIDEDYFLLGGDSLLGVKLLSAVDQTFDRRLPLATLLRNATVEGIASALGARCMESDSLLVPLQTVGSGTPLFCIHPLGGHVFCYSDLAQAFAGRRRVIGIRAYGIEGEGEPDADVPSMAQRYVRELKAAHPAGPFAICGWSMGGMIALEMGRQLRAAGEPVALIAPIDTSWPRVALPITDRLRRRGLGGLFKVPRERLNRWRERQREFDRAGPLGRVLRAAHEAASAYEPERFEGEVLLVRSEIGLPSASVDLEEWRRIAGSGLQTIFLPGGHWDALNAPVVDQLASALDEAIASGERRTSQPAERR